MSTKEIVFADPSDVDLAVPSAPSNLLDVMRHYPLSWERAGNCCYFGAGGALIGLAAERHNLYPDRTDKPAITATWPALYIESGKATLAAVDNERARKSLAAFSAGPMLVSRRGILDIPSRIAAGGYDGFDAYTAKPQRAIGITASGEVADGIWESATLYEVAEDMIAQGCLEVMKLDGGGSSGIVESEVAGPKLMWGWAERALPAVVVIRHVKRIWRPRQESVLPVVDLDMDYSRKITANFRLNEYMCQCGCGTINLNPAFVEVAARLQMVRDTVKVPVNITSGSRCPKHDREVGSSADPGFGPHTRGAVDVWWDGATVDQMAEVARACGFTGIGRYPGSGFVHLDMRQPAMDFIGKE